MQAMTRSEAADKLLDRYAGYYDISPAGEGQAPLVATCDFHAHSEKYVLSRKAKLWEAGSHEYVFVFSVPHLTEDIFNACRDYAYEHGMAKVEPGPNHMYSYITAMFLCDTCEKAAKKALRRCRMPKPLRSAKTTPIWRHGTASRPMSRRTISMLFWHASPEIFLSTAAVTAAA